MNLIELLQKVGVENVEVQPLNECVTNIVARKGGVHLVTFPTHQLTCRDVMVPDQSQKIGLVVWIPRTRMVAMNHQELVGKEIVYISRSGRKYDAVITAIPENPGHACCDLPTVSLEFRDERGKLVRKGRVLPVAASSFGTKAWKLHPL